MTRCGADNSILLITVIMPLLIMIISMALNLNKMIVWMQGDLMASLMASVAVLQMAERKKP